MGAQFANIGEGKAIDLTDIKVTGYEEVCEGEVYVQTLDAKGRGGDSYFFVDIPAEDEESEPLYGWYDGNDEPVEKGVVTIAPGAGLWLHAPSENYGIQTAGEVSQGDYAVTLREGCTMVVNSTPVAVDLTKIVVTGYEEVCEGEVYAQTLNAKGRGGDSYFFVDVPAEDEESEPLFGWFDGNDEPVEEGAVIVAPGEGLWTNAPSTDYIVEMPGVELKK